MHEVIDQILSQAPFSYWVILLFLFGLCVGSFLNVVIARLPKMILDESYTGNLLWPRSHCLGCNKTISWYHNIPLLSFVILKGRCNFCHAGISMQYPIVEFVSGFIAVMLPFYFGLNSVTLVSVIFCWFLLALFVIDVKSYLLPDGLTLSLLWLGLLVNSYNFFVTLSSAVYGAMFGYVIFWLVAYIYKILRKKEGLGLGDAKFIAALGAWFGIMQLPLIIAASSILALIFAVVQMCRGRMTMQRALPLGPFLAIVAMVLLCLSLWSMRVVPSVRIGGNVLPPAYLAVADFKKCLATQSMGTWEAYCLPETKPDSCPQASWDSLNSSGLTVCGS
jgi:leader peptidase (prepilin peptidase) / N-methyltransferase